MASTYTSNLGVEKPDSGDRSNTWGTMVNANMNILDRTASGERGTLTIPISGMPPATGWNYATTPQTLNLAPTSLGDGHYAALTVTDAGDLGFDVYLQVTPATAKRTISIRNSLSGARNLIIYQGTYNASYAYTVANGYDATIVIPGDGASAIARLVEKQTLAELDTESLKISGTAVGNLTWPVGSIFISVSTENPGVTMGFGTWVRFAEGKTLFSQSSATAALDTAEETGGSASIAEGNLPAHTHSASLTVSGTTNTTGAHTHTVTDRYAVNDNRGGGSDSRPFAYTETTRTTSSAGNHSHTVTGTATGTTGSVGSGSDYYPPYIVVYMWKRTA